jgi:hypothetical protein
VSCKADAVQAAGRELTTLAFNTLGAVGWFSLLIQSRQRPSAGCRAVEQWSTTSTVIGVSGVKKNRPRTGEHVLGNARSRDGVKLKPRGPGNGW